MTVNAMATRSKNTKPSVGRKSGPPEESTAKFRNKILGLSAVAEQNSVVAPFYDHGNPVEQKDIVTQLNEELARRQVCYPFKQEKDLLRAFRARLYSVQEELESEKNKTDDGASAWIEKSKQLETEVEWTKELADRLDRLNQSLTRENQRLKTQFSTQENDREFLVKQLVTVKKDNVSLRTEVEVLRQQLDQLRDAGQPQHQHSSSHTLFTTASTSSLPKVNYRDSAPNPTLAGNHPRPNTAVGGTAMTLASDGDNRYKEIIKRLKRLLEVERRNLHQVRTAYKMELQNHTELEVTLKDCVQDVRSEIAQASQLPLVLTSANSHSLLASPSAGRPSSEGRLNSSERQQLIEKLLEKEQLLSLLTAKAFPVRNGKRRGDPLLTGEAFSPDEVARLLTDVSSLGSNKEGP
ncbi:hypothetical protein BBJ29_002498 [Phytophthora kernoviae]|uniref:Uncharacterized protein n=1 Tax=Phytophthora kernoviae TaxID=325452 RepID=A0A3F2RP54_9STRA|nr:hypothetical protein BBJ29_002498 [Phytophthora kernoviae]RLN61523.1 hypothetical protein BBP00_00005358 [Phytophthora kernoviae]